MADSSSEPKVRHEFVGMMFAVTIGEVGLQVASLVHAKHYTHFLPFYTHLLLATIVITSSWVGWSLSQAPGNRRDVDGMFTWGFCTLLLDVFLVITYFIMVRTIELGKLPEQPRIDTPEKEAWLIVLMFALYLVWDVVTKMLAYDKLRDGPWGRNCGLRMIPTLVCLFLAVVVRWQVAGFQLDHYVNADIALLGLALAFRALKDVVSEGAPRKGKQFTRRKFVTAILWSSVCIFGIGYGIASARYSWRLLPSKMVQEIVTPLSKEGEAVPSEGRMPEQNAVNK
jgi:hypothetical protein